MTMNKTSKMYNALLQELQTKAYDPSKNIHRKYTCRNDVGIIYSMSVASRMRALEIPADKMVKDTSFPVWQGVKIDLVTMPEYSHQNQMYIELQQMPGPDAYIFEIVESLGGLFWRNVTDLLTDCQRTGIIVKHERQIIRHIALDPFKPE